MKLRLALALGIGLAGPALAQTVGPSGQIACNQTATMAVGPTSVQSLVAGVAGKTVFVCGWHVTNTGATGTFSITTGTQTTNPCDTGTKSITPALNVTNAATSGDHVDWAQVSGAVGAGLCLTPSVATIAAVVWFSQY